MYKLVRCGRFGHHEDTFVYLNIFYICNFATGETIEKAGVVAPTKGKEKAH